MRVLSRPVAECHRGGGHVSSVASTCLAGRVVVAFACVSSARRGSDRHLRLRLRWAHRGPVGDRPAAARVGASTSATPPASPTGPSAIAEVREYAIECLDHLVDRGVKALVIACNSASRRRAARRPGAVRRPRGRGDPAGDPARGRRHPERSDRRDLHPRDGRVDGLRGRVRRRAARRPAHPGLSAVRRLRRGRRHRGRGAARRRPRLPRPADRGRRRHAGPRAAPTTRCSPASSRW